MTTRDEIIALAEHNGIYYRATPLGTSEMFCFDSSLEAFYHAAQRQAYGRAAEVAESIVLKQSDHINGGKPFKDHMHWEDIATAIRDLIEGDEKWTE